MKKIRLRKWVEVTLKVLLLVDMFFMVCDAETITLLFIKTIITMPLALVIIMILKVFNCLD